MTLGVRGFRGFLAEAGLTGGAGVARGFSCGESKRLMSMVMRVVASKVGSSDTSSHARLRVEANDG